MSNTSERAAPILAEGGSAGCALTSRLSIKPVNRALLLETYLAQRRL